MAPGISTLTYTPHRLYNVFLKRCAICTALIMLCDDDDDDDDDDDAVVHWMAE